MHSGRIIGTPGADASALARDRTIAVLGYGNQGTAHALNLRDSGMRVIVGAREGSDGAARARRDGFETISIEAASASGDLLVMALPDEVHGAVWTERIEPHRRRGVIAGFLHGFSVRYGRIELPADVGVVLVAPKGPGRTLRERFVAGLGLPCLFAVQQTDAAGLARDLGLAWAHGIGCGRAAVIETTFADETETDLFGEQAVLCGGMSALVVAAFETLVDAGYPPALAYMECCQEVKQVADLVYERGLAGMMDAISNTAEFGAYDAGSRLVDDEVRSRMRAILADVRGGSFARRFVDDCAEGAPWFAAQRAMCRAHPIEAAGAEVRSWMTVANVPASVREHP